MSLTRQNLITLLSAALLLVVGGGLCPVRAEVGFQAKLRTPRSFVSLWEPPSDLFSVSLPPKSRPFLSSKAKPNPKVERFSYEQGALTFGTVYYRRPRDSKSLVPVTVDARQYNQFRRDKAVEEKYHKELNKSVVASDKTGGRGGLGVTVGLPKRLDQMFGEGGAGLVVSGYRRISFSGRSQWRDGAGNDAYQQSKFPTLNMEQESRFDITGTIGTKISVKVSQNSKQDIPLSNRIQIRYKGDDDDILKSIEAGNTTLSLPNTRFVGYSSRINGLFGLKAEAQVGSLTLTAIASQEKGTTERTSFSPTGEVGANFIRDYDYADGRVYDLGLEGELAPGDEVVNIFVYEQVNTQNDLESDFVKMVVDPDNPDDYPGERVTGVRAQQMDEGYYEIVNDPEKIPYVVFTSSGIRNRAVAIWMQVVKAGQTDTTTFGDIQADTLVLKLLKPGTPSPSHVTWDLMWRNCYYVGKNASLDELDIKIFQGLPGSENSNNIFDTQEDPISGNNQKYIEIVGLDQYNTTGSKFPDGRVDELLTIYRSDWGLLIFPEREPFNTDRVFADSLGNQTQKLDVKTPDIYNKTYNDQSRVDGSKYFISVAIKTQSTVIKLNQPNIIEGSERVMINGELLIRDTDYRINYDFGEVTLQSAKATDPNADIEIDYEYAPFLAVQKKTLLGMRAEYEWSKNLQFGGTVLYKSDKAQERKPRVGQETSKILVYDFDASLKLQPNFITKALDALPLIETQQPSNLSLSGEVAQSHPNPNIEGVAYIDDFESAVDRRSLGSSRVNWQRSSLPVVLENQDYLRGKILWHSPRDVVDVDDVYDRESAQGEGSLRTFRMIFRPQHDSAVVVGFNADTTALITETVASNRPSWGGIMRYFSGLDATRAQLFEIRMRTFNAQGKLHFDFGQIDEDINGDGFLSTEDSDLNGAVDKDEDTGVDMLPDHLESEFYHPIINPDPNGDNWWFDGNGKCPLRPSECDDDIWDDESKRYEWLNGTEGNWQDISVLGNPDREKLTGNENRFNLYYAYTIDLATDSFVVEGSEKNDGNTVWKTFRIPIRDSTATDGIFSDGESNFEFDWGATTHVRVWFEADQMQTKWDTVEIADWYFVQSQWQDSVVYSPLSAFLSDEERTSLVVASASEEDGTFSAPPGVEPYTDNTTNVTEAQRGLAIEYTNLNRYDSCLAFKELIVVDQYSGYRGLEMYIHSDTALEVDDTGKSQLRFFFRIGEDSENFYEYQTWLYRSGPGQAAGWDERNHVKFDFNELTAFKDSLILAAQAAGEREIDGIQDPYRVKGSPNLNQIRYFCAGLVNKDPADTAGGPSGVVWLDELRVTDVRKDIGTAGRFSASGNLADLLNYSFTYQSQDPYFRKVSTATRGGGDNNLGSGKNSTQYSYNLSMNIDRFLPRSWGASMPLSYSYSKSVTTPLLRTNSDIVLAEETRIEEQSISESRGITISEKFNHRGGHPLFTALLNRQNVRVSYRRSTSSSVNTPHSFSEGLDVKTGFDLGIKTAPTLPIFFWTKPLPLFKKAAGTRLGLYPARWTMSLNYSSNTSVSDDKSYNRRSSLKRDLNGTMTVDYKLFQNLSLAYTRTSRWDMSDMNKVNVSFRDLQLGEETRFQQTFSTGYDPSIFRWFTSGLSFRANYSDEWDRTTDSRRSTMTQSWGVNGKFDHRALLGARGAGIRRRAGQGRKNVRGGGTQDTGGKPFYDPALAVLRFLTGWIEPPTYSYSQDFKATLPGMAERPALKYRFGLARDTDVPIVSQTQSPSSGEGEKYSASSGFMLLGGIKTDVSFNRTIGRDLVKTGNRLEQTSTGWPELAIRITSFQTLPLLKPVVNKIIDIFAPRTSYSRSTRETFDLDNGFYTAKSTSVSRSPLLSINFKVFRKLTLSASYSLNQDESMKFNQTTGEHDKTTRSTQKGIALSTQYSFSAPGGIGIPLLGKIKFQSQVSIQMAVKINSSLTETASAGKPWVVSTDKSDTQISTQIKYSFSRQINGGISTRWQDSNDAYRGIKSHAREVQLWVELKF